MAKTCSEIAYLSREAIIEINFKMISSYGGIYLASNQNLLNESALNYIIEAVSSSIFGQEIFPSIFDKAAAYAFHIIKGHPFVDGNKRTGIESAFAFLGKSGFELKDNIKTEEIIKLAEEIENSQLALEGISKWFRERAKQK